MDYLEELQKAIDKVIEEYGIVGVGLVSLSRGVDRYIHGGIPIGYEFAKTAVRSIDGRQFENPELDSEGNIIVRDQYGDIV
jgi:hypothetical protein